MAYGSVNVPGVSAPDLKTHTDDKANPHAVTKAQVGLGNVDDTSDADKPISNATQTALNGKANTSHTHAATDVTQDSSHRFVTDSEKTTWNGKANASHGMHVSYSSTSPKMDGAASAGTATTVARSDHVHPSDSSKLSTTGTAAAATKLATARTIQTDLASTSSASFNGTVDVTPGVTGVLPIANGGTGANEATQALAQLNAMGRTNPTGSGSLSLNRKADTVVGFHSVTLGYNNTASGTRSMAMGESNVCDGASTFAIGHTNTVTSTANALSMAAAIGKENTISTKSPNPTVIAIGKENSVTGSGGNTFGYGLTVSQYKHCVTGIYNAKSTSTTDVFIIGKGTSDTARANCFRATDTGVYASGSYNASGADYAELFEWLDGNPDNVDRIGLFVTLDGEKIRLATPDDTFILGVISGNPSVVGDVEDDQWRGMYLYDIYGRPLWEDVEISDKYEEMETVNEDGETVTERILMEPAHTEHRQKLNPDYDSSQPYQKRTERKEWGCVGMMGKLVVNDDGSCVANGWAKPGEGGIAVKSETPTKYRVMSRIDDMHIRILIL